MQRSSEAVAGNRDILTEILLRLPVKPLAKFKSVSKQWLSLISDPKFCHSHTLRHHTPHPVPAALLLNNDYTPSPHFKIVPLNIYDTDLSALKLPCFDYLNVPRIHIIQSCNGLLLCSSGYLMRLDEQKWETISLGDEQVKISFNPFPCADYYDSVVTENDRGFRYYICNPTTMQFATVTFPNQEFREDTLTLNLAFHPLRSPHYKVISIRRIDLKERKRGRALRFVINVYSSETGSWSDRDVCFTPPTKLAIRAPVYFNGAIHWYCEGKNSLYFDVEGQCLETLPMPPEKKNCSVGYFGEYGGHFHMALIEKSKSLKFKILELNEDYSGWSVRYRVDLTPMQVALPELVWDLEGKVHSFSVLGVFRQAKEEDSMVVLFVDGRTMSFNLVDHTSRKLCDLEPCGKINGAALDYEGPDAYLYFENLLYVEGFTASA